MDRFRAVQAFARVVEFGSFARAAEHLGTSTSAVSRLVADLEAHLDARLIHRTTRRLSLTEVGQSFYERSVQLLADLDEAESSVRAVAVVPRGVLRLTCGVSFGERFLAPAISEFSARHRDIVWDLDLSDRAIDLVEEGFDLAIRIGTVVHQGLVSRRLGWTTPVCCASPAHLARHGTPRTPADLASHEVLSYTLVPLPQVWRFESAQGERHELRVTTRHRAQRPHARLARVGGARRGHRTGLHRRAGSALRRARAIAARLHAAALTDLGGVPEPAAPVGESAHVRRVPRAALRARAAVAAR